MADEKDIISFSLFYEPNGNSINTTINTTAKKDSKLVRFHFIHIQRFKCKSSELSPVECLNK